MGVDLRETTLIVEALSRRLGLPTQTEHLVETTDLETRGAQIELDLRGLAGTITTFRQSFQHLQGALVPLDGLPVGTQRRRLAPGSPMVVRGALPFFRSGEVSCQLLDVGEKSVRIHALDGLADPTMEGPAPVTEPALISGLLKKRLPEAEHVRRRVGLIEKPVGDELA